MLFLQEVSSVTPDNKKKEARTGLFKRAPWRLGREKRANTISNLGRYIVNGIDERLSVFDELERIEKLIDLTFSERARHGRSKVIARAQTTSGQTDDKV